MNPNETRGLYQELLKRAQLGSTSAERLAVAVEIRVGMDNGMFGTTLPPAPSPAPDDPERKATPMESMRAAWAAVVSGRDVFAKALDEHVRSLTAAEADAGAAYYSAGGQALPSSHPLSVAFGKAGNDLRQWESYVRAFAQRADLPDCARETLGDTRTCDKHGKVLSDTMLSDVRRG